VVRDLVAELQTLGRIELDPAIQSATEMVVRRRAEQRAEQAGALVG
jgi:hypothetical protein